MARRKIYPTLPGEVAGRTGDMNAEINRRESQFARMPFVPSKRLVASHQPAESAEAGIGFTSSSITGSIMSATLSTNGLSALVPAWITAGGAGGAGTGLTTVGIGGALLAGNLSTNGLSLEVPSWITTAMASNAGSNFVGLNTAQTNVTWTVNSSGISLNAGAYAGTVFATVTTAGANITATFNTGGLTLHVPVWLTTAMASNANTSFVGLNTAETNVTWTVNSSGISLNAAGYAGTVSGATNCNVTANTAGVSVSVPPGAGVTLSRFENMPIVQQTLASVISGATHQIQPWILPFNLSASYVRFPGSNAYTSTTMATIATGATGGAIMYESHNLVIHSQGTGASSMSLQSYFSSFGACTYSTKWSISGASACSTLSVFYDVTGATASNSTTVSTNLASLDFSSTFYSTLAGLRWMDIPCPTSFSAGLWFMDYCKSSSSATSGDASLAGLAGVSNLIASRSFHMMTQENLEYVPNGNTSGNATDFLQQGLGIWSTNSTGVTTASIPISLISTTTSNMLMYFQILRTT